VTGTLLAVFVGTVWAYSISAVKQDTFDDIDIVASEKQVRVATLETASPNRLVASDAMVFLAYDHSQRGRPARTGRDHTASRWLHNCNQTIDVTINALSTINFGQISTGATQRREVDCVGCSSY